MQSRLIGGLICNRDVVSSISNKSQVEFIGEVMVISLLISTTTVDFKCQYYSKPWGSIIDSLSFLAQVTVFDLRPWL